jgi:uncharacterized protein involved in propanediol utilization
MDDDESLKHTRWETQMPCGVHSKVPVQDGIAAVTSDLDAVFCRLAMILEGHRMVDHVLTAAAGGSQTIRFERFTFSSLQLCRRC